jgi:TPR repeat protein
VAWLTPAALKGYAPAQLLLSRIYYTGRGVTQNTALALAWLKRAAQGGDAEARHQLGYWYSRGIVVKRNYLLAHVWFNLSAASGHPRGANDRAWVAQFMTRDQVKRAEAMARGMR